MIGISVGLFAHNNFDTLFSTIGTISLITGLLVVCICMVVYIFHVCLEERVFIMGVEGLNMNEIRMKMKD